MTDILTALIVLVIVITIAAIVFITIWKKGIKPKQPDEDVYNYDRGQSEHQRQQESAVKPWLKIESAFTHEVVYVSERLDEKYGLLCGSGQNCDVRLSSPTIPPELFKLGNDEKGFYLNGRGGKKLRLVDGTEEYTVNLPAEGVQLAVGSDVVSVTFPCVQQANQPQTLVRRLE